MKRCSYCGKEYAEEVAICPLDGHSVVEKEATRTMPAAQPAAIGNSFSVKLISPISLAGTYRVLIDRNDLVFIQIEGGSKSVLAAFAPVFGPAGGLIPLALWLFTKKKTQKRRQNVEQLNPEELFRDNENNFKLFLAEVRDAAIEPATWLATSSKAGRLILTVRHGEKMKFEFESAGDVANALHLLSPLLHSALKINVEWNGERQQFQAKKTI